MPKNELVCLAMVYCQRSHAYAINEFIKIMKLEKWAKISRASLYNTLKRLEKNGCLKMSNERLGEMPERKCYSMTDKGILQYKTECIDGLRCTDSDEDLFPLALTFNLILNAEETSAAIEERIRNLRNDIETLEESLAESTEHRMIHSGLLCRYGIEEKRLQIDISMNLIAMLREQPEYFTSFLKNKYSGMMDGKT